MAISQTDASTRLLGKVDQNTESCGERGVIERRKEEKKRGVRGISRSRVEVGFGLG